jgi:hypothetical protein
MALTSAGLLNGGLSGNGHYRFQYDDSLSPPINPTGPEPARTQAVMNACEADFNLMSGWFANTALDVGFPIPVNVTQFGGGASWSRDAAGNLTVTINPALGPATFVRYLLVAEMTEQFMRAQGLGWFGTGTEGSQGEGLSRFLAAQFLLANGLGNPPAGFANSNNWMASPRADYVNFINPTDDGPDVLTGCSLLFIWYLFSQLGFSVNAIVAAGASPLSGVYRNLTGDPANPFPTFKRLLDNYFPGTATIPGPNPDNPFPLANPFTLPVNHIFWDAPTNQLYRDQWTQAAAGDAATMVWPDQQHIFYRGTDDAINHVFWDAPTNQLYWDDWTQRTGAPAAAGDPATMVWPDQQHIFYRGTDDAINHIFWDAPSNQLYWDQWTQQTGAPAAAGDPATMVWPDQQHIFYRGTSGGIIHIFWDAPSNQLYWDDWTERTGAPAAAGDPAAMAWPGQQHIFYRGTSGGIIHIFWDASSNQLYWDDWTQRTGAPAAAGDPATMVWPDQQHIFYRGTTGTSVHIFWDAPSNQLYWDDWTQDTGAPAAVGDPATMVWPDQQHIFYRGADAATVHIFWDAPSNLLYWDEWNQETGAPADLGDPATMMWPGQQHIFYRG